MKNHFYISYFGNKRTEAEAFYNIIDLSGIDKVIEPFAGTAAINYKNDKRNLIILDPPYVNACNDFYLNGNMNIYEYLYNNKINDAAADIYLILEDQWIIQLLFKNFIISHNAKMYSATKKKTHHLTIYNKHTL